jgi:DNA-binding NarL/FixJ family response regulator
MQDSPSLLLLEAAGQLAISRFEVMRGIAQAASALIPQGPIVVAAFDARGALDPGTVQFERADLRQVLRFHDWQRAASPEIRRLLLGLSPGVLTVHADTTPGPLADYLAGARQLSTLCVMANTGSGGGIHLLAGCTDVQDWSAARIDHLRDVARHVAAAWRIREALEPVEPPETLSVTELPTTPRDVLRRIVVSADPATARANGIGLWPALVAGRWTLLDAFTAAGARHIVAYRNPDGVAPLRALLPREQFVVEFALGGQSGKWIAIELDLSESAVARTLRTALRKLGVADAAALAGIQGAEFARFDGLGAAPGGSGIDLAVARLTPAERSLAPLSQAERDIVADILTGKRVTAIAYERGTSPRTVAHQIASVYRKLGASSRRELLALLS